eukprot:Skav201021  [mRNA]  locus=scaffold7628:7471:7890:+ [translate_table: standard]
MVGTCAESRSQIQVHLNYNKWASSGFTSDLLRSSRWLIGASPKNCSNALKPLLTVTAETQSAFLRNHISWFSKLAKKTKVSARARNRPNQSEWDKLVDFACIMHHVSLEAKKTLQDHAPSEVDAVLDQIDAAFMARHRS